MNGIIAPVDLTPDNLFVPNVADGWSLPQSPNGYASVLDVKDMTLLIAGFLALLGLSPTTAQLEVDAATYSCLPTDNQIAAVIYQLTQTLTVMSIAYGGGLVYAGNYNGNAPPFTPPSTSAVAIDSVTFQIWNFVDGGWE